MYKTATDRLLEYVLDGNFRQVNQYLRGVGTETFGICETVEALDQLTQTEIEPALLYRGICLPMQFMDQYHPGACVADKAFVSTSLVKDVAIWFGTKNSTDDEVSVVLEIHGATHGCIANDHAVLPGNYRTEHEVILPRNTRLEVVSVSDESPCRIIHAQVI